MNKKIKTLAIAGLVTLIAGTNVISSHAINKNSSYIYLKVLNKKITICVNKPSNNTNKPEQGNGTNNDNNNNNNNNNDNTNNNTNNDNNNESDINKPSGDVTNGNFDSFQREVLKLVNEERNKAGLKPLTLNSNLSNIATIKSQDMINKNYFSHTSPTYGSPFDMMKKFGVSYKTAAENIAKGQTTPQQVMNSWMNSSGHRSNILNPNFTQLGVGVAKSSNGTIYWTQMFIG